VPQVIVTHPLARATTSPLPPAGRHLRPRPEAAAEALCADFEREWQALSAQTETLPRQKVLYLIWQQPWLSVARDTYISRMLAAAGWDSLPVDSALRYPEVDLPALAGQADWLLLSSEPYPFREKHLRNWLASSCRQRATLIDGEMVSWYGSRAIRGLAYLRRLRARLGNAERCRDGQSSGN
jgi:hypothetical protein